GEPVTLNGESLQIVYRALRRRSIKPRGVKQVSRPDGVIDRITVNQCRPLSGGDGKDWFVKPEILRPDLCDRIDSCLPRKPSPDHGISAVDVGRNIGETGFRSAFPEAVPPAAVSSLLLRERAR